MTKYIRAAKPFTDGLRTYRPLRPVQGGGIFRCNGKEVFVSNTDLIRLVRAKRLD